MITKEITINNKSGMSLRSVGNLMRIATGFDCSVIIKRGADEFNAKSILGVMTARLKQGDAVIFECVGSDEYACMRAISEAAARGFE